MIKIKVYNTLGATHFLELTSGTAIQMEQLMPAFDTELEVGEFSLPFSAPMSDPNRLFLGFPENFNTQSNSIPNQWRCDVYSRDILIISDAVLRLLSFKGTLDGEQGEYSFNISGIKSTYGKLIKGKTLQDLQLDGVITWDAGIDCRTFAKAVMGDPAFAIYKERIVFPPVVIQDYFDTTRNDYNGEILTNDTANNIVANPSFTNGWTYGVEDITAPGSVYPSGTSGYEFHRTIPFFKLTYVLRKCFVEFGYTIGGSFFDLPEIDKLLVYNNCSIEKYDPNFPVETGRSITPANHMPTLTIYEFIKRIQKAFNLKLVPNGMNGFLFNLNDTVFSSTSVKNLTAKAHLYFDSAKRNTMYENGYRLRYESDATDQYWSDRVKDTTKLNVVASVNLYSDIAGLALPSPTNDQHVYVIAENYYYQYNDATTQWEPYAEGLWEYQVGKGDTEFNLGFAPLCEHYGYDAGGNYVKKNRVGIRHAGTYINMLYKQVYNEFGLRLFFYTEETTPSYTDLPRSYCHNYNADGTKFATISLSITHADGLWYKRFLQWIRTLQNSWDVQAKLQLDELDIFNIIEQDIILIMQSQFILRRIQYEAPLIGPTEAELIKL